MGYETNLILVGVIVPKSRRASFKVALNEGAAADDRLAFVLKQAVLTEEGWVQFRPRRGGYVGTYECRDDDGLVGSIWGKWYQSEEFAEWLCAHGARGRVIQHSLEGDGMAWGWEFRAFKIRELDLVPVTDSRSICPSWRDARKPQGN